LQLAQQGRSPLQRREGPVLMAVCAKCRQITFQAGRGSRFDRMEERPFGQQRLQLLCPAEGSALLGEQGLEGLPGEFLRQHSEHCADLGGERR